MVLVYAVTARIYMGIRRYQHKRIKMQCMLKMGNVFKIHRLLHYYINCLETNTKRSLLLIKSKPSTNAYVHLRTYKHCKSVGELIDKGDNLLRGWNIPEPKESTQYFIAHVLGKPTLCGIPLDQHLDSNQVNLVEKMLQKRLKRVPVQYILGEWNFCDLTLKMAPPVFIPRPETEELVGYVKTHLKHQTSVASGRILEVGCGSGAISLALLKEFPQLSAVAIDKTQAACNLTTENSCLLGLEGRIQVLLRDITDDVSDLGKFDILISNPPYISSSDMDQLDPQVSRYEDVTALHGGRDGLDLVRIILTKAPALLKRSSLLWLEVDTYHPQMIHKLVEEGHFKDLRYMETLQDYTLRDRFSVLQVC